MQQKYDGILLFSGGLDSILAGKILTSQGLKILGVHFTSPFFGESERTAEWSRDYGLEIVPVDIGREFARMLASVPAHGLGKTLNPCVDCKILLLTQAREIMTSMEASFVATGEVLGQRPMSQRRDTLDIIAKKSGLSGRLLRPLSAMLLKNSAAEESGLVDRGKLLGISGRSRNEQMNLAARMGISPIPGPGGGCLLTQRENARKYWPLLRPIWQAGQEAAHDLARDFELMKMGRVLLCQTPDETLLLCIGRNERDNALLKNFASDEDLLLRLPFPGPLGLACRGRSWAQTKLEEACAIFANFSPRARKLCGNTEVMAGKRKIWVTPASNTLWNLPTWEEVANELRQCRKAWARAIA